MATKAGIITLVRHGEPALSRAVTLNAAQYEGFWAQYEIGGLKAGQTTPGHLVETVREADVVFVSTRLRARESATILVGERDVRFDARLIEAPLPAPPFPKWLRMSPKNWGFFARFWWWYFNNHKGQESRGEATIRARSIATEIADEALAGRNVLVVAHGFFNAMLGIELRRLGWSRTCGRGWKYWSTRQYQRR